MRRSMGEHRDMDDWQGLWSGDWLLSRRRDPLRLRCRGMLRMTGLVSVTPGRTCDIAITSCLQCERWWSGPRNIYIGTVISWPRDSTHVTGHKDIDPSQAVSGHQDWFQCVLLRICPGLPVVLPSHVTPGSMLSLTTVLPPPWAWDCCSHHYHGYYRDHHSITVSNKSQHTRSVSLLCLQRELQFNWIQLPKSNLNTINASFIDRSQVCLEKIVQAWILN